MRKIRIGILLVGFAIIGCNSEESSSKADFENELDELEKEIMSQMLDSISDELSEHRGYKEKNGKIYHLWVHGGNWSKEFSLVEEADPSTFNTIKHGLNIDLGKDSKNVYVNASVLDGADPNSFEQVKDYFWKDKNNVYLLQYGTQRQQIDEADPSTFEVLGDFDWSKDNYNVYYRFYKLPQAMPSDFTVLSENWGKDQYFFYYNSEPLDSLDHSSAEIISEYYIKDKSRVYYRNEIVTGANPETFVADGVGSFGHDDKNMFSGADNKGPITENYKNTYFDK